jgi:predicted kinase
MLIIITGLPGTGKTTFGKQLSNELQIPFISRDALKELMFDYIGVSDREWSKKLGVASYKQLYYILETLLQSGNSVIVESNFNPKFDNETFQQFQKKYGTQILQVIFRCEGEVLYERFKQRAESGERHPGHADSHNLEEFKDILIAGKLDLLGVDSQIIEVDTTDFSEVDFDEVIEEVKRVLS